MVLPFISKEVCTEVSIIGFPQWENFKTFLSKYEIAQSPISKHIHQRHI